MIKKISPEELAALLEKEEDVYALVDVRDNDEYRRGQIFAAANIPTNLLEERMPIFIPVLETKVVLYSNEEDRSKLAAEILESKGYSEVLILDGGLNGWEKGEYPLVEGGNVLSETFGEIIASNHDMVSMMSAQELKTLMEGDLKDYIVMDVRPHHESLITGTIPGAICVPAIELTIRISDYAQKGRKVITTCAGGTMGLIANATCKMMGLEEVYALTDGLLGWQLAGFKLGKNISFGPQPATATLRFGKVFADRLVEEHKINLIDVEQLKVMMGNSSRETLYLTDVRNSDEFRLIGHIPGSVNIPGGQAIQNAENVAPVSSSNIVFICNGGTRAIVTAFWYMQMGFSKVFVLKGGMNAWSASGESLEMGQKKGPLPEDLFPLPVGYNLNEA